MDQVQEVGSSFFDTTKRVLEGVGNVLKPGIEAAVPIVKQTGEQALKIASPAISEASKKAQEAIQSSGFDTQPVLSAAKVSFLSFIIIQMHFFVNYALCFCCCSLLDLHTMCL